MATRRASRPPEGPMEPEMSPEETHKYILLLDRLFQAKVEGREVITWEGHPTIDLCQGRSLAYLKVWAEAVRN